MSRLSRLLKIAHIAAKYRLDQLLPDEGLPLAVRTVLAGAKLYPSRKEARGVRLRYALEELGPIFVKFGQLLSTRPDIIPPDIALELNHLQDRVTPFCPEEFRRIVEQQLGAPVEELFATYEGQPMASASVAQVHAATLSDGREVVVKVTRPGIEATIEQDIRLLFTVAALIEKHHPDGRRLRPVEVVEDYQHTIRDELDLHKEAANTATLRNNFKDSPMLYVPEVIWDYQGRNYCTDKVMVSERIYGVPVTNVKALVDAKVNMRVLAERGVEIFFTQVFRHNFFHADMHPGNIFVNTSDPEKPQYIGIDCAIVGSLDKSDQYYLARNLLAVFQRDYRLVAELHVQCGWVPSDTPINAFESAIRSVCEPIFQKPLGDISLAQILIQLFQTARRFNMTVQPQLVLLQKTLLNIEGLGRQLYPQLDLWQTAQPFLEAWIKERFNPRTLWREVKRYAPDWLEQFPEVPNRIFNGLGQLQQLQQITPELQRAANALSRQRRERRTGNWLRAAGLGILAGAVYSANPAFLQHFENFPLVATLAVAGVLLLIFS